MRKITSNMLRAMRRGETRNLGNTTVTFDSVANTVSVRLHGNLIAVLAPHQITVSLCGWNTRTTRDRVNAILGNFALEAVRFNQVDFGAVLTVGPHSREVDSFEVFSFDVGPLNPMPQALRDAREAAEAGRPFAGETFGASISANP